MKTVILFCMAIFSWIGSYVPVLWGGSLLSIASLACGALGGFLGIWAGYKLALRLGLAFTNPAGYARIRQVTKACSQSVVELFCSVQM